MPVRSARILPLLVALSVPLLFLLSACQPEAPKSGTIAGVVYDAETNSPIVGVNLTTDPATSSQTSTRGQDGSSPGAYSFAGIPLLSRPYTVKASKPGYVDKAVQVSLVPGGTVVANIHMVTDPSLTWRANHLLLYYPFAGDTRDMSGNGNHGSDTYAQPVYDRFGRENSALGFDGQTDYIVSTRPISVGPEFTVLLWVFHHRGEGQGTLMLEANSDLCSQGYGLELEANGSLNIRGAGCPAETLRAGVTLGAECWHMVGLVVRNSNLYLYVDGVQAGYPIPAVPVSNFQLTLGAVHPAGGLLQAGPFKGQIDDVRVYDSALPPDAIRALFGAYDCIPAPAP